MGSPRARDWIIGVLVVGMVAYGMFAMSTGMFSVYDVGNTTSSVETALQDNQDVIDTVDSLRSDMETSDSWFDAIELIWQGFKVAMLAVWSVFTSITAMVTSIGQYFGLGAFATYFAIILLVGIIFTVWRALQGRDGV